MITWLICQNKIYSSKIIFHFKNLHPCILKLFFKRNFFFWRLKHINPSNVLNDTIEAYASWSLCLIFHPTKPLKKKNVLTNPLLIFVPVSACKQAWEVAGRKFARRWRRYFGTEYNSLIFCIYFFNGLYTIFTQFILLISLKLRKRVRKNRILT